MSLTKVNSNNFFPEIASIWEDFLGRDIMDMPSWRNASGIPAVNIEEKPEAFEVSLAVPGMQRENFKIEVSNGVLSISSEKEEKHEEQDQQGKYTRREFSYRSFSRSFRLPDTINADQIAAKYTDGILAIRLPKKEPVQAQPAKQITIG
ncbi:MAG: Hsp20/alpha crystallin family protein [Bacteroidota bacterium]